MIPLLGHPPAFFVVTMAVLSILFALVGFGHAVLGLLRNVRRFRSGG
jgi:hypothetical protein